MGTNYYLRTGRKIEKTCDLGHVHRVPEELHIGKSSFGWYFTLHLETAEDGRVLNSLKAWQDYYFSCPHPVIIDEERRRVTPEKMWKIITREGWEPSPFAKREFKQSLIGKPVDQDDRRYSGDLYTEWGERGFVKTHGMPVGKDGLYVLLEGEFS